MARCWHVSTRTEEHDGGVERGKREQVFEYHCVKTVTEKYITFHLKTIFEVRHGVEPFA